MKQLSISLVLAFSAFFALNAHAVYVPGAEKPFLHGAMQVKSAVGEFNADQTVELTMTRHEGSNEPSGMLLVVNGKPYKLVILDMRRGKCGDMEYLAIRHEDLKEISFERTKLVLHDHSTRQCDDYQPNRWEARIQHSVRTNSTDEPKVLGLLQIAGNPKPVITIQ